jgi:carotenoid cleavage dioxygenase-like enzyme
VPAAPAARSLLSAHSKIDPETGNLVSFGYNQTGPLILDCTYMEVSPADQLLKEV